MTLPNARQYEPVIDEVFNKIQQQLSEPQPEQPNPEMLKVQQQGQKNQQDFAIKQEQNRIKQEELALKKQIEHKRLNHVVEVMSKCDLIAAKLLCRGT